MSRILANDHCLLPSACCLLPTRLHDRQNVFLAHDEQLFALDLDLGAGILGVEHLGALAHLERRALAVVVELAWAYRQHGATLWLLLSRIGQDHAASRNFLPLRG